MPKKMVRNRVRRQPTPEQTARFRQAVTEVDAVRSDIVVRGKGVALALHIAQELKAARQSRGLPAAEIAARMGIDAGNFSRLEAGQGNPTLETVSRLAEAIGVDLIVSVRGS